MQFQTLSNETNVYLGYLANKERYSEMLETIDFAEEKADANLVPLAYFEVMRIAVHVLRGDLEAVQSLTLSTLETVLKSTSDLKVPAIRAVINNVFKIKISIPQPLLASSLSAVDTALQGNTDDDTAQYFKETKIILTKITHGDAAAARLLQTILFECKANGDIQNTKKMVLFVDKYGFIAELSETILQLANDNSLPESLQLMFLQLILSAALKASNQPIVEKAVSQLERIDSDDSRTLLILTKAINAYRDNGSTQLIVEAFDKVLLSDSDNYSPVLLVRFFPTLFTNNEIPEAILALPVNNLRTVGELFEITRCFGGFGAFRIRK